MLTKLPYVEATGTHGNSPEDICNPLYYMTRHVAALKTARARKKETPATGLIQTVI
jgi:hypothetical protein